MGYEIIGTGKVKLYGNWLEQVRYRTDDGKVHEVSYTPCPETPEQVVERNLAWAAEDAEAANHPPGNFGMFVKMDGSNATYEELKQQYRDFCRSRGYEVDEKMVPYKPAAAASACPPAPQPPPKAKTPVKPSLASA